MRSFKSQDIIEIRAKPNSSKSLLIFDDENNMVIAFLHSVPDNGKANTELVKLFKKQLKLRVELIKGFKSRDKKVLVL